MGGWFGKMGDDQSPLERDVSYIVILLYTLLYMYINV